ncbi:MAG TPA: adenylate/guanylate cyclase domain-containing protein, partial [Anaerolineae bacterium]|nr:adenylate/guanylate cyclase domain-containing protein [Anaerolineae bacterium]
LANLGLGIGIATGEAVVGNIGTQQFMDYTVIGHIPNLAKRLQETAMGGQILVDVPTYEQIADFAYGTPALPLYGKGMLRPVKVFEVVGIAGSGEEKSRTMPLEASYDQAF